MRTLYKGQVGSKLYGCDGAMSDNDYFILAPDNDINSERQINITQGRLDNFVYSANVFHAKLFSDANLNLIQYNYQNANVTEQLFSLPDSTITTPLSEWLIQNRQLILDSNRQKFKNFLLVRGNCLLNNREKHIYHTPPKTIIKAIINLQTYINYAANPEEGFFQAQHLTPEQLEMVSMTRQGLLTPAQLYDYVGELKQESLQYADFWNEPMNIENTQQLANEMRLAIDQSLL